MAWYDSLIDWGGDIVGDVWDWGGDVMCSNKEVVGLNN